MNINYGSKRSRSDRWLPAEDIILWNAYKSGATYKLMMKILGRGYPGIASRLRRLRDERSN